MAKPADDLLPVELYDLSSSAASNFSRALMASLNFLACASSLVSFFLKNDIDHELKLWRFSERK